MVTQSLAKKQVYPLDAPHETPKILKFHGLGEGFSRRAGRLLTVDGKREYRRGADGFLAESMRVFADGDQASCGRRVE